MLRLGLGLSGGACMLAWVGACDAALGCGRLGVRGHSSSSSDEYWGFGRDMGRGL